ncbi:MAG: lipopolysaccharide biosynthesis protein [Bacteroidales bacterium]
MGYLKSKFIEISGLINKGHERSVKAKKNILASFMIKGLSIAISLVLVPLTINYINPSRYGIWLTLSSIVAWFSFFDIGFGNGLRNKFTEAKATGNFELARIYVSTTYAILIIVFIGVWFAFCMVNFFIDWSVILNAPPEMADELSKLALIVFSFFCLQMILITINTVIIADQKPAKSDFFNMLGQLLALCIIGILTNTTQGSLIYLGFVLGFAPIFILFISSIWFYAKQFKQFAPSIKYVRFSFAKDIMAIGIKFFFIQIAFIVIYQTNNVIITHIGTPGDVTIFNIAYKYMGIVLMSFSILISPFWSAITEAFTIQDYSWIKTIVKKLRLISYLLIIVVIFLFLVSKFAYSFWIGNSVRIPSSVTFIVGIYIILLCWVSLNTQILNGIGKISIQLITYLLGTILHIPLAIFLGKKLGIVGVIISASIFCAIITTFSIIQVNKILHKKAKGLWNK